MKKQLALITGATSGIGEEIARRLSQEKYDLILVGRNQRKLGLLKKEFESNKYKPRVTTIRMNLATQNAAKDVFAKLHHKELFPSIIVNNAGFGIYDEVKNYHYDDTYHMLTLNVTTLTQICSLGVDSMIEHSQKGLIVNVGSTASFQPIPYLSAYGASKSYVLYFSQALQEEVREHEISISTLCPGPTKTKFEERANPTHKGFFKGNVMSAREVANICYRDCIENKKAIVVCGTQNKIGAAFGTLSPKALSAKFAAKLLKKD